MDKILIRGLKAPTVVGILEWERQVRQELSIDLDLFVDTKAAAKSDDFELTVDYAAVSEVILAECAASEYQLIETLCEHLVAAVFENFDMVQSVRLLLKKPGAVPEAEYVGIELERSR